MSDQFTREDVTTLLLEVMDGTYVQATRDRPMTDAEKKVIDDIRAALAAPRPEPGPVPVVWRYLLVVEKQIVREKYACADWDIRYEPFGCYGVDHGGVVTKTPLYAAPPAAAPEPVLPEAITCGMPFVVKHYTADLRPTIKGNGFDGLEIGISREEAEEFVAWVNARIAAPPAAAPSEDIDALRRENERLRGALQQIADETYDTWTNGANAQHIAESALKEVQP
jgi:hypothetical protein